MAQQTPSIGPAPGNVPRWDANGRLIADTPVQFPNGQVQIIRAGTSQQDVRELAAAMQNAPQPFNPAEMANLGQQGGAAGLPSVVPRNIGEQFSAKDIIDTMANMTKFGAALPPLRAMGYLPAALARTGAVGTIGTMQGAATGGWEGAKAQGASDVMTQGAMEGASFFAPRIGNSMALSAGGYTQPLRQRDKVLEAFEEFNRNEPMVRRRQIPGTSLEVPTPNPRIPIGGQRRIERAADRYSDRIGELVDNPANPSIPAKDLLGITDELIGKSSGGTTPTTMQNKLVSAEQEFIDEHLANIVGQTPDERLMYKQQIQSLLTPAQRENLFRSFDLPTRYVQDVKTTASREAQGTIKAREVGNLVTPEQDVLGGQFQEQLAQRANTTLGKNIPGYTDANAQRSRLYTMEEAGNQLRTMGPSTFAIRGATGYGANEVGSYLAQREEDNPLIDRRLAMLLALVGLHPSNLSRGGQLLGRGAYAAGQGYRLNEGGMDSLINQLESVLSGVNNAARSVPGDLPSIQDALRAAGLDRPTRTGR